MDADLHTYAGFGIKAAGGEGDNASGAWVERELHLAGFAARRQLISVPFFEAAQAILNVAGSVAPVIPQAVVVPTGPAGISGPLERVDPRLNAHVGKGSIAVIELPFRRWSTATAPMIKEAVSSAERDGAVAAILITTGPSGGAVALNSPAERPMFAIPVVCLGQDHALPALAACEAKAPGRLVVAGRGGRRSAFNVIGSRPRKANRTLVVSTPRSGWFTCGAERGPGIATFLSLARWAPRALPSVDLLFTCNTGHEYENAGSEELVQGEAPDPDKVALWLHLGAGFAARDWQEVGGRLRPLDSADPQRAAVATDATVSAARVAFANLPGLSDPFVSNEMRQGETGTIIRAGYDNTIGLLGAHRFHHHPDDDLRCASSVLIEPVVEACRRLLLKAASQGL
jgi:hypothetical protein